MQILLLVFRKLAPDTFAFERNNLKQFTSAVNRMKYSSLFAILHSNSTRGHSLMVITVTDRSLEYVINMASLRNCSSVIMLCLDSLRHIRLCP